MARFDIDWRYVRGTAIFSAVCVGVCVLIIGAAQSHYHLSERDYSIHKNELNEYQEKYHAAQEDLRLLQDYYAPYKKLVRQGMIGEEHRLYWVEVLRDIADTLKLKKVNYRIEPQQPFSAEYLDDSGDINVYSSRMFIQMDLLHEGDLLYVVDQLNARAPGSFHVSSCKVKRLQQNFSHTASSTNMMAECELQLFTLKAPQSPEQGAG